MSGAPPLHATLVAYRERCAWSGVLVRGPSGAGKSEVALRLLRRGWRLVADDRVLVWSSGGRLWGRAPEVLHGLLEVRSVGVLPFPALSFAEIVRVVDCTPAPEALERIPADASTAICGVSLPIHTIDALACSAADKVAALCGAVRL